MYLRHTHSKFDSSSTYDVVCGTCGKGADHCISFASLFPERIGDQVAALAQFLAMDSVSLFHVLRFLQELRTRLDLKYFEYDDMSRTSLGELND